MQVKTMTRIQFGLRSILVLATLVASFMLYVLERQRYFREHVFIKVVDNSNGVQLSAFRYRTWLITKDSPITPEWSPWVVHHGVGPLPFQLPANCKLKIEAQASGFPPGLNVERESMLVSPEVSHQLTLRVSATLQGQIETETDKPKIEPVEPLGGAFQLKGQVVNDKGTPIPKFRVWTIQQGGMLGSGNHVREYSFNETDGRFQIFGTWPFIAYLVQADQFALAQRGSVRRPAKPLEYLSDDTFQLSRGVSVSGRIEQTKQHSLPVEVTLTDLSICDSLSDAGADQSRTRYDDDEIMGVNDSLRFQYQSRLDSKGRYEFHNLAKGTYAMLVRYNDQTVTLRPVVVDSTNIEIPDIKIPAVGTLQGVVKEWNEGVTEWNEGERSPVNDSRINPFANYYLMRTGETWGKPFRTNHLGEFRLENVLVGTSSVQVNGVKNKSWAIDREVFGFGFRVQDSKTTTLSPDTAILCELEIESSDSIFGKLDSHKALLHGVQESEVWIDHSARVSRNGFTKLQFHGRKDLPSGSYTLDIQEGPISIFIEIEHQRDQPPTKKQISFHGVSATVNREQSGSMGGVAATLIRDGKPVSGFHLPFDSDRFTECWIETSGPFDVLFYDHSCGWAIRKNISFASKTIELGKIDWQRGGQITVELSLDGLDMFPEKISLRQQETGQVLTEDISTSVFQGDELRFTNLMPGKWAIEVSGTDPLVGSRTLFQTEVKLVGTEEAQVSMVPRPH